MPSTVYGLIRQAIIRRQQVLASYHGQPRSLCPHAIGLKHGVAHCLAYQFAGGSRSRVITKGSPDNWRCLVVGELEDVRVREGAWYTAWNFMNPSACIDEIDVSVV